MDFGKKLCLRLKCSVTTDLPNVNGVGLPSSVFILISLYFQFRVLQRVRSGDA